VKFLKLDFASLGSFVQKMYKVELKMPFDSLVSTTYT